MFIIPYLVLAAVALLFFFICYMMFFGVSGRKKTADHREIEKKASEVPSREDIVKKVPLQGRTGKNGRKGSCAACQGTVPARTQSCHPQ